MKNDKRLIAGRFWKKVSFYSYPKCWIWNGAIDVCGYGRFLFAGKNTNVFKNGNRGCVTCRRNRSREHMWRKRHDVK